MIGWDETTEYRQGSLGLRQGSCAGPLLALDQLVTASVGRGLRPIGGAGLVEDIGNVVTNRAEADDKLIGNFTVGLPGGD